MRGDLQMYIKIGDLGLYKTFLKQQTREVSQKHFRARQRPDLLARTTKGAGIEEEDEEPIPESDPEPEESWKDCRLQEAPERWGRHLGAGNQFGQLSADLSVDALAELPRNVVKRQLNETGVPVVIPKVGKVAATQDPRAKELGGGGGGDSPVLELLGDEWAAGNEPPKSGAVVPPGDTEGLRKKSVGKSWPQRSQKWWQLRPSWGSSMTSWQWRGPR